jgi:uncharacterized protein YbjT (DUF2867 family)
MANSGRVLITGTTGKVGSVLLDNLANDDIELRALAHDESQAQSLRERGEEAVLGDFLKPETLGSALEGVSTVFLLTPIHPQQVAQASNVIQAARGSGKDPRIVRLSVHQASHRAPTRIEPPARRDRRHPGSIRVALHPHQAPTPHAEHSYGRPDCRLGRQDLPADEGR